MLSQAQKLSRSGAEQTLSGGFIPARVFYYLQNKNRIQLCSEQRWNESAALKAAVSGGELLPPGRLLSKPDPEIIGQIV